MTTLTLSLFKENESVREYAYRTLRENILKLKLKPGDKISEKEISDTLSISRTPVREAFIRLSQEQLLEVLPQRGTYISKINTSQIAEFRFLRVTLQQAVMKLACEKFPPEYQQKIIDCLEEQSTCVKIKNYSRFFELDNGMHSIIFSGCEKPNIWQLMQNTNLNYIRSRVLDLHSKNNEIDLLFTQHQQIVEAILNHDSVLGNKIITEHINKVIGDIEELKTIYPDYFE